MSLPKIQYPVFNIEIPSLKKKKQFRPFLVREEKLLLMAKLSENEEDTLSAIKQVVNNCSVEKDFNINDYSIFDLEYMFIKIRSASVDNIVKVSYRDFDDEKVYDFDIDLNDIIVKFPKDLDNKIKISDNAGLIMKYPDASLYDDKSFLKAGEDAFFQLILKCIDKIYDGEEMYECSNYSTKEVEDFVNELDVKTFEKIQEYMSNQPKLYYKISYKNSTGKEKTIELDTLSDFFTLR